MTVRVVRLVLSDLCFLRLEAHASLKGIFVRAVLLGLLAIGLIGVVPLDTARGQNRAAEVPGGADASPPRRGPTAPAGGAGRVATEAGKLAETGGVEASPLDTIWMRDAKGNLVPVVGIPFEEFEQLLRSKKGLAPSSPP